MSLKSTGAKNFKLTWKLKERMLLTLHTGKNKE